MHFSAIYGASQFTPDRAINCEFETNSLPYIIIGIILGDITGDLIQIVYNRARALESVYRGAVEALYIRGPLAALLPIVKIAKDQSR